MGRTEVPDLKTDYERAGVGMAQHINESEMARSSECTHSYAQKVLDAADIVREAIFHQLTLTRSLGEADDADNQLIDFVWDAPSTSNDKIKPSRNAE
jgi:hypothetical protein